MATSPGTSPTRKTRACARKRGSASVRVLQLKIALEGQRLAPMNNTWARPTVPTAALMTKTAAAGSSGGGGMDSSNNPAAEFSRVQNIACLPWELYFWSIKNVLIKNNVLFLTCICVCILVSECICYVQAASYRNDLDISYSPLFPRT